MPHHPRKRNILRKRGRGSAQRPGSPIIGSIFRIPCTLSGEGLRPRGRFGEGKAAGPWLILRQSSPVLDPSTAHWWERGLKRKAAVAGIWVRQQARAGGGGGGTAWFRKIAAGPPLSPAARSAVMQQRTAFGHGTPAVLQRRPALHPQPLTLLPLTGIGFAA